MTAVDTGVRIASLVGAVAFVLGLHLMNSPATARRGNQLSAAGMTVAVLAVVVQIADGGAMNAGRWLVLVCGIGVGAMITSAYLLLALVSNSSMGG